MIVCPACGTENPDGAKFCNACASPLEPERSGRKERKYATALFADLVGSTELAEREDPEVVQSVVGRTFDRLSDEIARYEGLLRSSWETRSSRSSASRGLTRTTPNAPSAPPSRCRRSCPS